MVQVFLLQAQEEYDDTYELGIFESLDAAIEGRKTYREQIHAPDAQFTYDYHCYVVNEFTLGALMSHGDKEVDRFYPSKTKRKKK